jgi:hypothetical protein
MKITQTASQIKNTALLGESVLKYWWRYFSSRSFPKNQEFYVVYTNLDHDIPFQPDSARDYWLINLKFIPTSIGLGKVMSKESFRNMLRAYEGIAKEGCAAFREIPTIMPHFTEHRKQALQAAQTLLKPINCSPSLHTATPFFAYNLAAKYFPETEPQMCRAVGSVVSTVIKTKLHAMIDIAFGMYLSKKTVEDKLGQDFLDLESFFMGEQKRKDKIPYEHIYRMYHEINGLEKTMGTGERNLPKIMERYFQETGLPRVKRGQSDCFYDMKRRELINSPGLRIGKGLF